MQQSQACNAHNKYTWTEHVMPEAGPPKDVQHAICTPLSYAPGECPHCVPIVIMSPLSPNSPCGLPATAITSTTQSRPPNLTLSLSLSLTYRTSNFFAYIYYL